MRIIQKYHPLLFRQSLCNSCCTNTYILKKEDYTIPCLFRGGRGLLCVFSDTSLYMNDIKTFFNLIIIHFMLLYEKVKMQLGPADVNNVINNQYIVNIRQYFSYSIRIYFKLGTTEPYVVLLLIYRAFDIWLLCYYPS